MKRILFTSCMTFGLLASGCGGGVGDAPAVAVAPVVADPTTLQTTDTVVGTGVTVVAGNTVTVNYTGWLYSATAANFRGTQFGTLIGRAPFSFKADAGQVIQSWDQGLIGMKVGGSRTLIIPSTVAYGSTGVVSIPPKLALVFTVNLLSAQQLA